LYTQQQRAEQEEEFITNRLTKRLTQLKREKQNLANEVGGGYLLGAVQVACAIILSCIRNEPLIVDVLLGLHRSNRRRSTW
jgi:Uncharacterized conserved protein H4 (DUF2046)